MKRKPAIIGILLLLVVLTLVLMTLGRGGGQGRETERLKLKETEKIDGIKLFNAHDSLILERSGDRWVLEGGDSVNQQSVENLLYAAGNLQIVSLLTAEQAGELRGQREVSFYKGSRLVCSYSAALSGEQFVLIPRASDRLFAIVLPGHQGLDLGKVFSTSRNHYMEHMLISFSPHEIRYIQVEKKGERPFRIQMDEEGDFSAMLLDPVEPLPEGILDDLSLRLLFSYFTAIRFDERLGNSGEKVMSREDESWLGGLAVASQEGELHHLEVFSMPGQGEEETDMFRALVRHNSEAGVLVVNYIYLDVLMRGIGHYFARED